MEKNTLTMEVQYLPGVGPKRAALLERELGIHNVGELIHLYPFRYIDRSGIQNIAEISPGAAFVQILARVRQVRLLGAGGADIPPPADPKQMKWGVVKRLSVMVADATGELELVFFRGVRWMYTRLLPGEVFLFFGKPAVFGGRVNMVHPEVDAPPVPGQLLGTGTLTGVYTSTEKLKNGGITGKVMNRLMAAALAAALPAIRETLPEYVLREKGLVPLQYALRQIHFPESQQALTKATYRLKFEELFLLQLALLKQKYIRSRSEHGIPMPLVGDAFNACFQALPYELTGAQKRVIKEIREDLRSGRQMNRLLQGDVGSGKTMVAVLSALIAVGNGFQACLMAPTEVLAQQHFTNVSKYLSPTGVRVALLTGSTGAAARREIHAGLADGSIGVLIGTHALIEDTVQFRALGLAVIDEQHRFGVDQRARLWAKGPVLGSGGDGGMGSVAVRGSAPHPSQAGAWAPPPNDAGGGTLPGPHAPAASTETTSPDDTGAWAPDRASDRPAIPLEGAQGVEKASGQHVPPHILVMTATPIPRTLAMTLYGDLDISVIDEMPPGRKPVQTLLVTEGKRPALRRFMKEQIARGRQVFVVYPLIFESEKLDYKNLEMGYEDIVAAFPLPDYKVAIVHGRQSNEEKRFNMDAFVAGRAQILVSTTVIEVGVDVPNASVMVIESAERFGLSQLHQLRGRVGRGSEASYCILMRGQKVSKESQKRLEMMCATENGFELAEEDMKMRGPGDLEGTQQSGLPIALHIASLAHDGAILSDARAYAGHILERDPALEQPQNAPLAAELHKEKYHIQDYSRIS